MNPERLLALFDRVSEAPDAVPKLRRFVLDLAVRGKLVEQDPADEPASLPFAAAEPPPDLPLGWRAARFGDAVDLQYGKSLPPAERLDAGPVKVFGSNGVVAFANVATSDAPAIIVGRKGSAGALNLCDGPSWTTDVAYFVVPAPWFDIRFLLLSLQSLDLGTLGKGVKPGLSRADVKPLVVLLPPLAEQRRIVARVDELMALCDQLEAARAEREQRRHQLTAAVLAHLNTPSAGTFDAAARLTLAQLPALTCRSDQTRSLRQTILGFAVSGKLVSQDATEAPSNPLAARQFSAAQDFDRKVFEEEASAVELPTRWILSPLAYVAEQIVDCPHTTPKWTDSGEICVRTNQLRAFKLDLSSPRFVSPETYLERVDRLEPRADDILYSREGGVLGMAARVPGGVKLCLGQRLMLIRPGTSTRPDYLELVLNSPLITDLARRRTTGGAAPRVNMSTVRAYPIPLPPLAEQHRIVARVYELMALCDQLEASLAAAETANARLLDAVLHEALNGPPHAEAA